MPEEARKDLSVAAVGIMVFWYGWRRELRGGGRRWV